MEMNAIEVRGVVKTYGRGKHKNVVLNKLNMTVAAGSIYCLLGSSGGGKTTLLASILGMMKLNKGQIQVLGHLLKPNEVVRFGNHIGYMPQETGLVGELTVKETIYFFGALSQIEPKLLKSRFEMLTNLLELPDASARVDKCSGGQKRRISFAVATVHNPALLILDEPTVGLDPLLKEAIWSYLKEKASTENVTVVVTTHYTAEALQADRVGFLRNGVLMLEDSPAKILHQFEAETLDEAFLSVCLKGESTEPTISEVQEASKQFPPVSEQKSGFRWIIVKELIDKNLRKFKRSPIAFCIIFLLSIVHLSTISFGSTNPYGLKVALVSDELEDVNDCNKVPAYSANWINKTCHIFKASCLLFEHIDNYTIDKVFFANLDEAHENLKRGKVLGILHVHKTFSESCSKLLVDRRSIYKAMSNYDIDVYSDRTNFMLGLTVGWKMSEVVFPFLKSMFRACNYSTNFLNTPTLVNFQKPIFGSTTWNFKQHVTPILLVIWSFLTSALLVVSSFLSDRKEGFWNRALLTGVHFSEMILSLFLTYTFILILLFLASTPIMCSTFDTNHFSNYILFSLLMFVLSVSAIFAGIMIATLCDSFIAAHIWMVSTLVFLSLLGGVFYPFERCREIYQIAGKVLPLFFPTEAVRAILVKSYGLGNRSVQLGFGSAILWGLISIIVSLSVLKLRKYSRNT